MKTPKQILMDKIGFLKWVRLADEDAHNYGGGNGCDYVYLSPDVHSLHIVWQHDGWTQYEQADYPSVYDEMSLQDFLDDEICDDAYETWEYERDPSEFIGDYNSNETVENIPVFTLKELCN